MIVFPFEFLQIEPHVLRLNAMVLPEPLLRPRPEAFHAVLLFPVIFEAVERSVADEAAESLRCLACRIGFILQRREEHSPVLQFPHAEDRCVALLPPLAGVGTSAALAVLAAVDAATDRFGIHHEADFPRHEVLLREKTAQMYIDIRDETVADLADLRGTMRREIEREAEEDVGVLLELRLIRLLVGLESFLAHTALLTAVFESVELRPRHTAGAQDMA